MLILWDTREVTQLAIKLGQISTEALNKKLLRTHMKVALKPMLAAARAAAPVGMTQHKNRRGTVVGAERISLKEGSRSRSSANYYRRGGATRRDLRIKVTDDMRNEFDVVGLVGVDKRRGKVGWRTHFITQRITLNGKPYLNPKHDFLELAYQRGVAATIRIFNKEYGQTFEKVAARHLRRRA